MGVAAGAPIPEGLNDTLNRLLAGTEEISGAKFDSLLQGSGTLTHFEELSTIDELKTETGNVDLGQVLVAVLSGRDEETMNNARRLISFLTAVEARALHRYTNGSQTNML
jgi:hypothetical protein